MSFWTRRRYRRRGVPLVIGLTGSIAMGKSTAARFLRKLGVPVHDADGAVHAALGPNGAGVDSVEAQFPGSTKNGQVDRQALGRAVFGDDRALKRLEALIHPLVRRSEQAFLHRARLRRQPIVALDIPLLFEVGADRRCDHVLVASATRSIQRSRVMRRSGMTHEKLKGILARQMSDGWKRRKADRVISTWLGFAHTRRQLNAVVNALRS